MKIARLLALGLGLFVLGLLARDDGSLNVAHLLGAIAVLLCCAAALMIAAAVWGARG